MERLVPFDRTQEKLSAKRSVIIRASHRELLSESVLLYTECWAGAYVQEFNGGGATALIVEATYTLFHYGNRVDSGKIRSDECVMPWVGGEAPLFPPISFGEQRIMLSVVGAGHRPRYPPLKPELLKYWDQREKTPDLPKPDFKSVVLPRHLKMVVEAHEAKET